MNSSFSKSPFTKGGDKKKRKRIMRTFKLDEISAVDSPAQEGATMTIIKRKGNKEDKPIAKVILLTDVQEEHQHGFSIDSHTMEQAGGSTEWASSGEESDGHWHPFVINADGTITIGMSNGHTHSAETGGLFERLRLQAALKTDEDEEVASKNYREEDGKVFKAQDYALVPNATDSNTWQHRLVKRSGARPDRQLVGHAVNALKRGVIPEDRVAEVTRTVRNAWKTANTGKSLREMPSVLKRTFV